MHTRSRLDITAIILVAWISLTSCGKTDEEAIKDSAAVAPSHDTGRTSSARNATTGTIVEGPKQWTCVAAPNLTNLIEFPQSRLEEIAVFRQVVESRLNAPDGLDTRSVDSELGLTARQSGAVGATMALILDNGRLRPVNDTDATLAPITLWSCTTSWMSQTAPRFSSGLLMAALVGKEFFPAGVIDPSWLAGKDVNSIIK